MNETEILLAAKDILMFEGWCQGSMAKTKEGRHVIVRDPDAVEFCSMGSVYKAVILQGRLTFEASSVFTTIKEANGFIEDEEEHKHPVAYFNDVPGRKLEEVLAAFDKAIAYSKDQGVIQ